MKKIKQWQKIKQWLLAVSPSGIYRVGYYVSVWFSLTFVALIFFVPDRKYSVFILLGYFISYATFNFLSFALLIFLRRKK